MNPLGVLLVLLGLVVMIVGFRGSEVRVLGALSPSLVASSKLGSNA